MLIPQDFETQFLCFVLNRPIKNLFKCIDVNRKILCRCLSLKIFRTHKKALRTSSTIVVFLLQRQLRKTNLQNSKTTIWYVVCMFLRLRKAISQCLLNYTVQRLCTASSKQKSVELFSDKRPLKCDFKSIQWGLVLALIAPSKYCLISDASTMLCRLQLIEAPPLILVRQDQRCKGEFYKSHNLFIIRKLAPQALGLLQI